MDNELLSRVHTELLDIAIEINRVCEKNHINYFLDCGTLLGAVRHKGFIPWDDDLDIGMLREDYERFRTIANSELGADYYWQDWHNEEMYPLPFGKVRKKNTTYIEERARPLKENGFYVDIFPYDYAPNDDKKTKKLFKQCTRIKRILMMQCGFKPWYDQGKMIVKKLIGYTPYRMLALFMSRDNLIRRYEERIGRIEKTDLVYQQFGRNGLKPFSYNWLSKTIQMEFEKELFMVPAGFHERLETEYGDYMQLPPENERGSKHGIIEIKFSGE